MGPLAWGLILGALGCLALVCIACVFLYGRWVLLGRRARHAERLAELGTLTGSLAHELRNPLSTVQLNLKLLEEDILPDNPAYSRVQGRLRTVQREASRLKDILDDFLRYGGSMELNRTSADLGDLLEELVDFYTPQAQLRGVQVRLRRDGGPVVARVDVALVKQAVLNLMLNAVQAMSQGGELILAAAQKDGSAVIDVIDTGPGIPAELRDKIFQAYYSTKPGGTGLGLAMTRRIAEEHGGRVAVTSAAGKGTDFAIYLPL